MEHLLNWKEMASYLRLSRHGLKKMVEREQLKLAYGAVGESMHFWRFKVELNDRELEEVRNGQ